MALVKGVAQSQTRPLAFHGEQWTPRALFTVFGAFRASKDYAKLIEFLTNNFACYVKNKTFNFAGTGHLFHSLYAFVPNVSELVKERKQIRLQIDCVMRLFKNTTNDFKMYVELFAFIDAHGGAECPCLLLQQSKLNAVSFVENLNCKLFDIKPPKFKKEPFDSILSKYSLNYKALCFKKKEKCTVGCVTKRQKKMKRRQLLSDRVIYLHNKNDVLDERTLLHGPSGTSLAPCLHRYATVERQTRAGDEMVSFIRYCELCQMRA
ncbi:late expression factor 5 [Orgyia pseudotsugata multiple nucleopolyhedrovirus]|uniref:Late expression factor 5 n=1 Tax=Orgyia pseudotsugata multicapsid polyhedrosis virus TaxID=262177 RepID=LEF5_NPVOP|nr:late expression factor 5 [Orgyia pseudotsugata multiple nucleopolyhedrovirus]O10344.1 RecName: Full=Late expression factor 5 [Orgyia pseudotsugata multiple nucleopolyhedrovirus]pir/T10369/ late expression factor 5 protein - Orgyia pseudotsugata nuclear polyhedrosis virus [Orgyia pseudotsugata single capsid nuclopolyhedrovirus]AAC59099.1 late expression factor 5 [Orgyia pseudotsugata multiple nucleopolyhedrovirus]